MNVNFCFQVDFAAIPEKFQQTKECIFGSNHIGLIKATSLKKKIKNKNKNRNGHGLLELFTHIVVLLK